MRIPFLNLKAHHEPIMEEIRVAMDKVIDSSAFAGGPFVTEFEKDFALYCRTRFAVGVGSGTDALWIALLAMGIGPGDEVITTPSTFIATAEAITYCGAMPVFVDIDPDTYNLNPELLEKAITSRTKAVIPVHLFGQCADMFPILEVARKHGLKVIEDASQAHGAEYFGRRAGEMGDVGCFSFYPGKNLGAFGEAGAVVTQDEALADRIRMFRDHGQPKKYYHDVVGWNGRMDGLQGAVLKVKLGYLEAATQRRRVNAAIYDQLLTGLEGVEIPLERKGNRHVYHLYAIRSTKRDALIERLSEAGIGSGIHYPVPLHLQRAYAALGMGPGTFPVAERCAQEFVSLPMYPELTEEQLTEVADAVKCFTEVCVRSYEAVV